MIRAAERPTASGEESISMPENFLDAVLGSLARVEGDALAGQLVTDGAREFLRRQDQVAALVRHIAMAGDLDPIVPELFARVLDEARMARENGVNEGAEVLGVVETTLGDLRSEERLPPPLRMIFAQIYVSVGLEPAEAILLHPDELGAMVGGTAFDEGFPSIDTLVDDVVRSAGDEALEIHAAITRMIAVFPPAVRGTFVAAIVMGERSFSFRLGVYWLLDRNSEVRLAAAEALRGRAEQGKIDKSGLGRLVAVRKWMPADAARAVLDDAVRSGLRREIDDVKDGRTAWVVQRVVATIPDGAGAQSIAVALQRGRKRSLAMLLLKQGHGVKDAFFIPCSSAAEQKRILIQAHREMGGIDVDVAFVPQALARALGDGAASGHLPATGLVDMAEIWGDGAVTPAAADPGAILAALDADGTLSSLTARDVTRLMNSSRTRRALRDLLGSWFEDVSELRDLLDRQTSTRAAEATVWNHLEGRRTWWATLIARTAATLKASTENSGEVWQSFAVTARALVEGRPLEKIAIMTTIADQTLAAAAERAIEDFDEGSAEEGPELGTTITFEASRPELPGEFAGMIAGSGLSTAWIEGFLAAIGAAPVFVPPNAWIGTLLGRIPFPDLTTVNRFLEILMARVNAVVDPTTGPARMISALTAFDAENKRDWAAGFSAFVAGAKSAWPSRALAPDDKRMLKSLAKAADTGVDDGLARLLPAWITQRYRARR
ncbi:MAG: YecA family protein [Phyllobacteriaceae bacterium]|nr:YecA family protein [Phyllobacteriaceae bacterium]